MASSGAASLIAGQYALDTARALTAVGGQPAFAVDDRLGGRTDLMAVQVQRGFPPRARPIHMLASSPVEGLLNPVAHGRARLGSGEDGYFVVCQAPTGASLLARLRPWTETELLECVLRPAALILEQLAIRGVTHRSIRLDNVFQTQPGQAVVLGSAWAAPPAVVQPAQFEPPYAAMCFPAARGEGSSADDVYALGVLMLSLALGRVPLAQLDPQTVLARKLELGSFTALAGDERLPPIIADLVRGMLAEDPDHRPSPTLLLDPGSARSRRLAARPPRRAQRPIAIAGTEIWEARSLARMMAARPEKGCQALRGGAIVQWLRRGLGDGGLASRLDELARHRSPEDMNDDARADAVLLNRAIVMLDPLAPLCWRGLALWPDGIGTALAATQEGGPDDRRRLEEIIGLEVAGSWGALRPDRCDAPMLRVEAHQQHAWLQNNGPGTPAARLTYLLNPLLPCAGALLQGRWVSNLQDLLPAMEEAAGRADQKMPGPLDTEIAAFIAARSERRLDSELTALGGAGEPEAACLAQLKLLAQIQVRFHTTPVPHLAAWIVRQAGPVIETWNNRERRAALGKRLEELAGGGYLAPILGLLEDPAARIADVQEAQQAGAELAQIDAELARLAEGGEARAALAYRVGQEVAAGIGLAALATMLCIAALR